jgi:hypothetical protein
MTTVDFITETYCLIDDEYKSLIKRYGKLRSRGFSPKLSDSELITMEIAGEYFGHHNDKAIWKYFKNNMKYLFPKISSRSSFVKQSANLWHIKQLIHHKISQYYFGFNDLYVVDGFPIPICHYCRSARLKCFKGEANYGYCAAKDENYYGFKGHIIVDINGVIKSFTFANPVVDERIALLDICKNIKGFLLADKGYIKKELTDELHEYGVFLQTPLRSNMKEKRSKLVLNFIRSKRRIVETVISQLGKIFEIQNVRVKDLWHLTNRIARKILAHNICTLINYKYGLNLLSIEPIVD